MNRKKREILMYAAGERSADMLYFSGLQTPDPIFAFTNKGKKYGLLSSLESGRAKKYSTLDEIIEISEVCKLAKITYSDIGALKVILKKNRIKALTIPADFPAKIYAELQANGFDINIADATIFPARRVKTNTELKEIRKANSVAAAGFTIAEEILRSSEIKSGKLYYNNQPLTSNFIRAEIEKTALSLGADSMNTIVASGNSACDPHDCGNGVIMANSMIVIDIFPRLKSSGYYGDMTRTFLKGKPTSAQIKIVEAVLAAQALALSEIKAGVDGAIVHKSVVDFFDKNGFKTYADKRGWHGFFHSTGHGLGLDVHESPSLGMRKSILEVGNVVTVEPGLYYKGIGGCRIEDNVVVTKTGVKMLSEYHYEWIIP